MVFYSFDGDDEMTPFHIVLAATAGYMAYRLGRAIVEEQSQLRSEKIHRSPPPETGVDVSAVT